jgi:uncharacterized protein (TIRG00374 family)
LAALGVAVIPQFEILETLWFWIGGLILTGLCFYLIFRTGLIYELGRRMMRTAVKAANLEAGGGQVKDFKLGLNNLLNVKALLPALGFTLVSWLFLLLACYMIVLSLSITVPFWFLSFAMAIAGLLSLLPISIAGIGVRDTALVGIFGLLGIGMQASLAYSLLYFAVFSIILGVTGAFFWYRCPVNA